MKFIEKILADRLFGRVYLFVGPAGVGKQTAAQALAAAALCRPETGDDQLGFGFEPQAEPVGNAPCGRCPACLKLAAGNHQDLIVLRPEDNKKEISVDQARRVIKTLQFAPQEADNRLVIIPRADELSLSAANALLKTLEEPPEHTTFILTVADAGTLPQTVVSRSQTIAFKPLGREVVAQMMIDRRGLDPERARLAADLARGSLGSALELDLDRALERRDRSLGRLAKIKRRRLDDIFSLAQEMAANPDEAAGFLDNLAAWYRDLMTLAAGRPQGEAVNSDRSADLAGRAAARPAAAWARCLEAVLEARTALKSFANPRLTLEAMLIRLTPGLAAEEG